MNTDIETTEGLASPSSARSILLIDDDVELGQAMREYGLDETQFPLKVIVAAVTSFQLGMIVEGLSNVNEGHAELLDWIQNWVDSLEAARSR